MSSNLVSITSSRSGRTRVQDRRDVADRVSGAVYSLSVQNLFEELGAVYALGTQRGRQASVLARSVSKALGAPAECVDRIWSAVRLYQVGAIMVDTRRYESLPFFMQIHLSALTVAEVGHQRLVRYLAAASFTEPSSIARLDLDYQISHAVVNLTHHDDGNVPLLVRIKSLAHAGYRRELVAALEHELEAKLAPRRTVIW